MSTNEAAEQIIAWLDEQDASAHDDTVATMDRALAAAKAEGWSEGYRAARLAGALDEEAAR